MPLSHAEIRRVTSTPGVIGQRCVARGSLQQSERQLRLPPSAIESEHELVQALLKAGVRHAVEGTHEEPFQIGDHAMNQGQPLVDLGVRRDPSLEMVTVGQHVQTTEAVRADSGGGVNAGTETRHRRVIHMLHRLRLHEGGSAIDRRAHRRQHRTFALRTPSALAIPGPSADRTIVQFDQFHQGVVGIAVRHRRPQLVEHALRRPPGDADHLAQSFGGQTALVRRHQVDGGEPLGHRQTRVPEDRPGRRRGLMTALTTRAQTATLQNPGSIMAARGTSKPIAPAVPGNGFETGGFRAEVFLPGEKIHRRLVHRESILHPKITIQLYSM